MVRRLAIITHKSTIEAARAKEALYEKAEMVQLLLDSTDEAIYGTDLNCNCTFANKACLDMLHCKEEDLLGKNIHELIYKDGNSCSVDLVLETSGSHTSKQTIRCLNGSNFPAECKSQPVRRDGKIVGVVTNFQDLTEKLESEYRQKQLETEIQHAQKLESLGTLAGGIAHDMNNVLAAIIGVTDLIKSRYESDERLQKNLDTIARASIRGRDLVRGLTDFARKGMALDMAPLDLNSLVDAEVDLLKRTTLEKIHFNLKLTPRLPLIYGDASSLANVVMNMAVNALHAMPDGGELTFETRQEGSMAQLIISDTGEGMPPEVLKRAMDPFFTTKGVGKGTGLGLSIAFTTLKSHGGSIELKSEVGVGTSVILSLQFAMNKDKKKDLTNVNIELPESLRILVVDDDELIRESVTPLLESFNFEVTTFSNGFDAIEFIKTGFKPDLILLDQAMIGMSGTEAFKVFRSMIDSPVIIGTGNADSEVLELVHSNEVVLLRKPYSKEELKYSIKLALDNHRSVQ
jgi:PAS domain S-box-containing protein